MKVSIIIPAFNEERTIATLLQRVLAVDLDLHEVIVIDDGSTDQTIAEVEGVGDPRIRHIRKRQNEGKGAAIRTGFSEASGDIVVIQDADLEYLPSEIPAVIEPIVNGSADVVFGSRFVGAQPHRVVFYWHYVANRFLTTLSNMFTNLNLTDMECCYKAFRREVVKQLELKENRFGIEPELTARVARLRCRCYEVGVSYFGRTYQEGKKIGWKDGARALVAILKYNIFK